MPRVHEDGPGPDRDRDGRPSWPILLIDMAAVVAFGLVVTASRHLSAMVEIGVLGLAATGILAGMLVLARLLLRV